MNTKRQDPLIPRSRQERYMDAVTDVRTYALSFLNASAGPKPQPEKLADALNRLATAARIAQIVRDGE